MCLGSGEPGGPRRCTTQSGRAFRRSTAQAAALEQRRTALAMAAASRIYRCAVAPFHIPLPDAVERLLQVTRAGGGNPLVVGGAVRDAALGAAPKDIDLEVHGIGIDQLAQCYRSSGYQVDEVGRAFGVLKIGGDTIRDLDIAVPRRDNKTGAGHRGFAVVLDEELTVEEAASRRDFTINALLYDPHHKVLLDPFSGTEDLQSRTLRHVSDHFGEDPLRVLRGVQLAGRFGLTLHPETAALCRRLRPAFADLPVERVQTEWAKLWTKGSHPAAAVQALRDSGWDDTLPGLRAALAEPPTAAALAFLPNIPQDERSTIGAAAICAAMPGRHRDNFLAYTVVGKDNRVRAADLAATRPSSLATEYGRRRYAHRMAARGFTFDRYLLFSRAISDQTAGRLAQAAVAEGLGAGPQPPIIQGRDVLAAAGSRKPGPWVGELVAAALDRQHRGDFGDRRAALDWLAAELSDQPALRRPIS